MLKNPDGWTEESKYVLEELKRLNACYESLVKCVNKISIDIAQLKIKAGIWGAFAGTIPVMVGLGIYFFGG